MRRGVEPSCAAAAWHCGAERTAHYRVVQPRSNTHNHLTTALSLFNKGVRYVDYVGARRAYSRQPSLITKENGRHGMQGRGAGVER